MTDVDSAVSAPDSLLSVNEQQQQQQQLVKQIEEEKVQNVLPSDSEESADDSSAVIATDDRVEAAVPADRLEIRDESDSSALTESLAEEKTADELTEGLQTTEQADEEQQVEERPEEQAEEEEKEVEKQQDEQQEEQRDQQPPQPESTSDPSSDSPMPPTQPATSDQPSSPSVSDSDDDAELPAVAALPPTQPAPTLPVPRSDARTSVLEQQIELEDKHDREYHVPHLADFDFSTPTPSEPSTPVPATPPPQPFRFDPSIILLPDTERFCAASLPLLYPKLALTLSRPDVKVDVKLSALAVCVDLLRSPLHVHELQAHGVLDELIVNAGAGDEQLRVLATEALTWAIRQREARHYCRENGIVGRMGTLLIDHSVSVRTNAASVLWRLSASEPQLLYEPPVSAAAGDAASVMAYLIRRVQKDSSDGVKAVLLRCILCGLKQREGLIVARYNILLPVLTSLLPLTQPPLIAAACDCLAAVAVEEVDRQELLSLGLHTSLLQWLTADDVAVRRSAAGALMQATVGVAVKQAVVAAGGVQICAERVKSGETVEAVLCVLLELLANLMESKKGKQLVAGDDALLTAVRTRAEDKKASRNLQLSAQSALQKLTYAP